MSKVNRALETSSGDLNIACGILGWQSPVDVSNLKLQKLLYYAQGEHVGATGRKQFHEPIEEWQHGPVVADVYHVAKHWGRNPIDPDVFIPDDFNWDDFSDVADEVVTIWRKYGFFSAWALREKTHGEAPWVNSFTPGRNIEITDAALKDLSDPSSSRRWERNAAEGPRRQINRM